MISRTTVKLKKLKGKRITVEGKRYRVVMIKKPRKLPKGTGLLIPSSNRSRRISLAKKRKKKNPGRPRKVGRPRKKGSSRKRRLPPRVKTGKRKGQFRKRKGSKQKRKKKKRGNPNNCW